MNKTNKTIKEQEILLLKKTLGKRLKRIEYVDVMTNDTSWNKIRLHFDLLSIDINCNLENLSNDKSELCDEFGIISITHPTDGEKLEVNEISSDTSTIKINKLVNSIVIINENIKTKQFNEVISTKTTTKSIIFSLEDSFLGVDRRIFYDEVLTFKFGKRKEDVFHDDSDSWTSDRDEDSLTFEYSLEQITKTYKSDT